MNWNYYLKNSLLSLIIFMGAWQSHAQENKNKLSFKNQLEYGANYTQHFGDRSELSGMGHAYYYSRRYPDWDLYNIFKQFWQYNTYLCYKAIINEKHLIKFSYETNASGPVNFRTTPFIADNSFYMKSLGYGYIFTLKKFRFSLVSQISQRTGSESVIIDQGGGFENYYIYTADLNYNSYGLGLGTECEYFFTKNLSIGANVYYFTFPFEEAKLHGDDLQYVDKSVIDNYKPITHFMNINFRLAYQFSFPSFKKK